MIVRELIKKLADQPMSSDVSVVINGELFPVVSVWEARGRPQIMALEIGARDEDIARAVGATITEE